MARLGLRQDPCQGPPAASLHRGVAPSSLRETRRALCPPPASAPPLAAVCCKTPRRRCRMPQPTRSRRSPMLSTSRVMSSGRSALTAVLWPRQFRLFDTPPAQIPGHRAPGVPKRYSDVMQRPPARPGMSSSGHGCASCDSLRGACISLMRGLRQLSLQPA